MTFFSGLSPCLISIEVCGSSHSGHGNSFRMGPTVRFIPYKLEKYYHNGKKHDANNAAAICEAVSRPGMRFVVFISESQQTLQEEYRVRARIIRERTALRNEIRGLLSEFGLLLPVGIRHVRKIQQGILPRGSGMTLHPFVVRTVRVK